LDKSIVLPGRLGELTTEHSKSSEVLTSEIPALSRVLGESPSSIILFRVLGVLLSLESPSPGELASLTGLNNILDLDVYVLYGR